METDKSQRLLLASTNRKKLEELQTLLSDLDIEVVCLKDLANFQEVPENGKTFRENASLKALGYARQSGLLTVAEDSGLCCDALEGAPGIYSARFAGSSKSDAENNEKLLKLLAKVPDNCRGAHFKSAVAIAEPEFLLTTMEGEVHGVISHEVRGENGFGYDPVFFYPPFGKTFGEVPPEMKHQVSHRAKALEKAKNYLKNYLPYRFHGGR
ncbi:MAG: RdgB/HAM1 family non-canonical purine NTP pyrophosphatase [Candidatus Omnitrophica bacterium]|nr:RdgB/HAM1 family non-canonical purine NTP pyrophosphatase [Candidatus Omnitrophota bacterium]